MVLPQDTSTAYKTMVAGYRRRSSIYAIGGKGVVMLGPVRLHHIVEAHGRALISERVVQFDWRLGALDGVFHWQKSQPHGKEETCQ